MKARVKATGEIKDVSRGIYSPYQYVDKEGTIYTEDQLEELSEGDGVILIDPTIDYWTRLEHQYVGMAMQGILMNEQMQIDLHKAFGKDESMDVTISEFAIDIADTLIQKLKEKEERK